MGPLISSALIGTGSSIVNSLLGQGQAKKNMQRQFDHNKEMAELEYQRNLELWNKQNAYNTPEAQMERFSKAGLNKNLIYGQGSPGNAQNISSYQVDKTDMQQVPALNVGDTLSQYNTFRIANAQVDNIKAQTELTRQREITESIQALIGGARLPGIKASSEISKVQSLYAKQVQENIVNQGQKNIEKTIEETQLTRQKNRSESFETAMKKIDKEWLEKNNASRLEPSQLRLAKELWNNTDLSMQGIFNFIARIIGVQPIKQ